MSSQWRNAGSSYTGASCRVGATRCQNSTMSPMSASVASTTRNDVFGSFRFHSSGMLADRIVPAGSSSMSGMISWRNVSTIFSIGALPASIVPRIIPSGPSRSRTVSSANDTSARPTPLVRWSGWTFRSPTYTTADCSPWMYTGRLAMPIDAIASPLSDSTMPNRVSSPSNRLSAKKSGARSTQSDTSPSIGHRAASSTSASLSLGSASRTFISGARIFGSINPPWGSHRRRCAAGRDCGRYGSRPRRGRGPRRRRGATAGEPRSSRRNCGSTAPHRGGPCARSR